MCLNVSADMEALNGMLVNLAHRCVVVSMGGGAGGTGYLFWFHSQRLSDAHVCEPYQTKLRWKVALV